MIVNFREVFYDDNDRICFITEYANGGDLFKFLEHRFKIEHQPLTISEITRYFTMICLGINYLNTKGIIHRDIKPQNIMLHHLTGGRTLLKVTDFDLSRTISSNTEAHTLKGTMSTYYASPQ